VAARDIIAELRRQHEEQKQLIHEQREIVNELRRHENVAHHLHDDDKYQVCDNDRYQVWIRMVSKQQHVP